MRLTGSRSVGLLLDPAPARWGWLETLALVGWVFLAGYTVAHHVPWADETQAWMLAGGVGWRQLFLRSLHYEGTGGAWHAFLKLLQAAHLSFTGARWLVAGIEAAAMAVLLRFAPFPRAVRLFLPFTFFLFFQDGIVARSYCLFAILTFPAAALLRASRPRPWRLALLLGVLANLSVHGLLLSAGLVLAAPRRWRVRAALPAFGLLLVFWGAAVFTGSPAPDVDFQAGSNVHNSLVRLIRPLGIHLSEQTPVYKLSMAGLPPTAPAVHIRHGAAKVWNRVARIGGVLTFPLSRSPLLALALLLGVAAQACAGRRAAGLLPWALMALVFSSLYIAPRHIGTVFTGFVVSAWLTWPTAPGRLRWLERSTAALLLLICVEQVGWTAHTLLTQQRYPYSPARETAEYLRSLGPDARIAGYYYFSSAPLFYFDRNIYFNQPPHRYWSWSTADRNYQTVGETLARHPDVIVVSTFEEGPDAEITRDWKAADALDANVVRGDTFGFTRWFTQRGYRVAHVFCGRSTMRASYAEQLCDAVLERTN